MKNMSDNIFTDDGQFTDEYKLKLLTHPVLTNLASIAMQASNNEDRPPLDATLNKFLDNIDLSAQAFFELSAKAFDQAEEVQHGLHLINCMLHQFYPELQDEYQRDHTYLLINKIFWGKYFYKNGIKGAGQLPNDVNVSPWDAAKMFALEYWRFGEEHFPETIGFGYQWLNENEPKEKLDFQKITNLLERFEYDQETILGFSYFLGVCASAGKEGEDRQATAERLKRLPDVDINSEYEALLGPLNDHILNSIFDELVWRFNGDFEPREIKINSLADPVYVYHFKNHAMIFNHDKKVQNLGDAETTFTQAMRLLGEQFQTLQYSNARTFKAGVCAANLRAQADYLTTAKTGAMFGAYLPLIYSAANRYTVDPKLDWSEHLDIQVPLQTFLAGLKYDLGKLIWSYQSYVLFDQGHPRSGISELPINDFMKHCKETLLRYYASFPEACNAAALEHNHWNSFPPLNENYDERQLILQVIEDTLGYKKNPQMKSDDLTLKSLVIFGYFCSLCETIIGNSDAQKIH